MFTKGLNVRGSRVHAFLTILFVGLVLAADPVLGVERKIGGAIYKDVDEADVLSSGEANVTVTIAGTGDTSGTYTATTSGSQGLWDVNVPEGTYTVTPTPKTGKKVWHMVNGQPDLETSVDITVNEANLAANQSIQFLSSNVGGYIYTDSSRTVGLSGVTLTLTPEEDDAVDSHTIATTGGAEGWWQIGVSTGNWRVTPSKAGETFTPEYIDIVAGAANLAANTTLVFEVEPNLSDPDPSRCLVSADPASLAVGETCTISITVLNVNGDPLQGIPVVVSATGNGNTIGQSAATDTNGQTTATITSTIPGDKTVSATARGILITQTASVTFTVGPVSASQSLIEASPAEVAIELGNHDDVGTITITAKDAYGNPIQGIATQDIEVSALPVGYVITGPTQATDASGQTTATIESDVVGTKTISVTINDVSITDQATVEFTAPPVLAIEKAGSPASVDAGDEVTYTITYENSGLGGATNTTIVDTLPVGLEYVSSSNSGVYDADAGTVTWTIGELGTGGGDQVSLVARVDSSLADGALLQNAVTMDCEETDAVQAAATTTVHDTQPPAITPLSPEVSEEQIAIDALVRLKIADGSGVIDNDSNAVTITIEGDLVYDGASAVGGVYDSNGTSQTIRGVCRRTGAATEYTFTFTPSVPYGYEKQVNVVVHATDEEGNASQREYYFWTQLRTFGANAKVNSDAGTSVQDNPATAVDPNGNIWVVWDQTNAAGDRDIYAGILYDPTSTDPNNGFDVSVPVATGVADQHNPAIAIDADGLVYVVWQVDPNDPNSSSEVYISSSTDGVTWLTAANVYASDVNNTSDQTSPAVAIDNNAAPNAVYVVCEDSRNGNQDIRLAKFAGGSWEETAITTDAADQTDPMVCVDPNHVISVVWTDAKNAGTTGTDLYGTSFEADHEINAPFAVVNTTSNELSPAGGASDRVYLLWVSDQDGYDSVVYGNDATLPIVGTKIVDEPNAAGSPAIAVYNASGSISLFACWADSRNVVNGNGDTDIYFAESSSPFGTNILVTADTAAQTKPAIGVNNDGYPYMVWVDERNGNKDIYYAGATALGDPDYRYPTEVEEDANGVITVLTPSLPNLEIIIPDVNALPPGVEPDEITFHEVSNPPAGPGGGFGLCYEFGPSGTEFSSPVTIRIPLDSDAPTYSVYNVYWYDQATLTWSTDGIHNPARKVEAVEGSYLEVEVDHFTTFATGGYVADGHHGGGGCSITAPWSKGNPVEFGLPFVAYVFVLGVITLVDSLRRRSANARRR